MSDIDAPVEERGTPEYYELLACRVTPLNPFEGRGLKPYKVSDAMAVGEMCDKAALAPYPLFLEAKYLAFYLNEGHICSQFMDIVQSRAVDMLVWEVVQQAAERRNAEFRFQQLSPLRANAWKVGYRS